MFRWIKIRLKRDQSGSVLIEFALISLALYLIMATTVEFGRAFLMANVAQSAANTAAALLSRTTIAKTAMTPEELLMDPEVLGTVYDPNFLVVDTACPPHDLACIDAFVATLPRVNQFLFRTTMIQDPNTTMFRYPGAVPTPDPLNPYGIVSVSHDANGVEMVTCCNRVLQAEIIPGTNGRSIHVAFTYPYQAVMLSDFGPPHQINPNGDESNIVDANGNWGVHQVSQADQDIDVPAGPYSGENGLGKQFAFSQAVRPYRKLLTEEAVEAVPMEVMP